MKGTCDKVIEFGFNFYEVACYKVKDDIGESDLHAGLRGLDLIVFAVIPS